MPSSRFTELVEAVLDRSSIEGAIGRRHLNRG
jgi:hypothetical protein